MKEWSPFENISVDTHLLEPSGLDNKKQRPELKISDKCRVQRLKYCEVIQLRTGLQILTHQSNLHFRNVLKAVQLPIVP